MDINNTIDIIHAVVEDKYPLGWDSKNDRIRAKVARLLDLVDDAYVHVEWPHSQEYMEQDWFEEEAVLDVDGSVGSSYFIPLARVLELQD
jgi:hypothetical protein